MKNKAVLYIEGKLNISFYSIFISCELIIIIITIIIILKRLLLNNLGLEDLLYNILAHWI